MSAEVRFAPVPWELIPDLGLYMDQVITFIGRIYAPVYGPEVKRYLSAAMINNYVKGKLIPRPAGKKYSREQIALLVMIVALKQVLSMEDIKKLIALEENQSAEPLYAAFCDRFSQVLQSPAPTHDRPVDQALDFAILAAGYQARCEGALGEP